MTLARLYGRVQGHSSLAVVTEGFRAVLEAHSLLTGVCPVDVIEIPEEETHAGASARHGIFTGHLGQLEVMFRRGLHQHYWIMLAPNSNRLPPDLVRLVAGYTEKYPRRVHLMAPSVWAADVVGKHFDAHWTGPVVTVPHGVSSEYHVRQDLSDQARASFADGALFRVLHFSTSAQQRKGTVELIQAWARLMGKDTWVGRSELLCVMDRPAGLALLDALAELGLSFPRGARIADRADLTPQAMAQNLSRAHVVCQPSRGEAFGLIPLEALCCGVPVVATFCTGHSEYFRSDEWSPGATLVAIGPDTPIDDLPGAAAPSLDPSDIVSALEHVRRTWDLRQSEALEHAVGWQTIWSWKEQLRPFVQLLRGT